MPDNWDDPPPNDNKGEPHLSEVENLVYGVDFTFGLILKAASKRHILYQLDV